MDESQLCERSKKVKRLGLATQILIGLIL